MMVGPDHRAPGVVRVLVALLRQVRQPEAGRLLLVVGLYEPGPVAADAVAPAVVAQRAPRVLHADARLDRRDHVRARRVAGAPGCEGLGPARVRAREVEEVDAREGDEEAADQRDGVDRVGGVEAAEEDEGGAEGGGREGYVVEGVDAGHNQYQYDGAEHVVWRAETHILVGNWLSALLK